MAGKQYVVVRQIRRVDPESGDVSWYQPGELYDGPIEDEEQYLGREGPDGRGPLLTADPAAVEAALARNSSGDDEPDPPSDAKAAVKSADSKTSSPTSNSSKGK